MVQKIPEAGYRFIPGVYQYSAGVAAEPGFRLERVRFAEPVSLMAGFTRIAAYLESLGRPKVAFAACELRSPAPFTEAGFAEFNRIYGGVLQEWGLFRDGLNPIARSNVPSPWPAAVKRRKARAMIAAIRWHLVIPLQPACSPRRAGC